MMPTDAIPGRPPGTVPPIVIRSSRGDDMELVLYLSAFLSGAMTILGADQHVRIVVSLPFIQKLIAIVVPPKLTIDEEGVHWRGLRSWHVAWSEIDGFRIVVSGKRQSILDIGIDTKQGCPPRTIPDVFPVKPRELQALLQARLDGAAMQGGLAIPKAVEPCKARPWLSIGLILLLILVFAAELLDPAASLSGPLQLSGATLVHDGGATRNLVSAGPRQWYRLVASAFLHGGLGHLFWNCAALFLAGRYLEGVIGRVWFVAVYGVGALAGAAGSLLLGDDTRVTVGATGAILGLVAAALVCSFHYRPAEERSALQWRAVFVLVLALLSLNDTVSGITIALPHHLGGALGGALMGLLMLPGWTPQSAHPPWRLGAALAGLDALACAAAVWPAVSQRVRPVEHVTRVADAALPERDNAVVANAPRPVRNGSSDPRQRFVLSIGDPMSIRAWAAANGLRNRLRNLSSGHDPHVEASLWRDLGDMEAVRGDHDSARAAYAKAAALEPEQGAGRPEGR